MYKTYEFQQAWLKFHVQISKAATESLLIIELYKFRFYS